MDTEGFRLHFSNLVTLDVMTHQEKHVQILHFDIGNLGFFMSLV